MYDKFDVHKTQVLVHTSGRIKIIDRDKTNSFSRALPRTEYYYFVGLNFANKVHI